jgi:hypothetical protein
VFFKGKEPVFDEEIEQQTVGFLNAVICLCLKKCLRWKSEILCVDITIKKKIRAKFRE